MPRTVMLLASDPRYYLDLARLGVEGDKPFDAVKTHAVGAALLVLASHLGSREADCFDYAVSQQFNINPILIGPYEMHSDFAWSGREQRYVPEPASDCIPAAQASTPEEWALMQLSGPRTPRDLTDYVIPTIRAATNLLGDGEPGHGLPRVRDATKGTEAIIVLNNTEVINPKGWPDLEAPTLAGMLRSRSLCAAVTLMFAKAYSNYHTRAPSCAGSHAGGRLRVIPAAETRARSWYPIRDIAIEAVTKIGLM